MKAMGYRAGLLALLMGLAAKGYAADQTVYGLQRAEVFQASSGQGFYIQTEAFASSGRARQYRAVLQSKTHAPVKVIRKGKLYAVVVGPLSSSAEVRATARTLRTIQLPATSTPRVSAKQGRAALASSAVADPSADETARQSSWMTFLSQGQWFVSMGLGLQYPHAFPSSLTVNNGSLAVPPYDKDIYTTKNIHQPLVAFSGGRLWHRDSRWFPDWSLGLYYQHAFPQSAGNTITLYSSPAFTNYKYHWAISSDLVLAMLKLSLFEYARLSPYLLAGAGGAFNHSYRYNETPLPGVTSPRYSAGYAANTNSEFAWNAGIGIAYAITPRMRVSAEYQYQDAGKVSLGNGSGSWSGQSLNLGTMRSNVGLVNLTWLFG